MSLIEWDKKYSVGINSIDEQHQQLIDLINRLNVAMAQGEPASVIADILNGLTQYTKIHFAYEEKLFDMHGYPESDSHSAEHQKMIDRVDQFHFEFEQDPSGAISLELMQFLTNWLTGHIQGSDKEYAPYLIRKGVD